VHETEVSVLRLRGDVNDTRTGAELHQMNSHPGAAGPRLRRPPRRGNAGRGPHSPRPAVVPGCLTIEQRTTFLLRPMPPHWCIEMRKYRYNVKAWTTDDP